MLNVGAGELMVILVVALLVLGPTKLPVVARQVGKVMTELRRMSSGLQREFREAVEEPVAGFKDAMDAPIEAEARKRGREITERMAAEREQAAEASSPVGNNGDAGSNGSADGDTTTG